ncbi:protein of unknown function [Aminobacter niigataensis]|nr:protein of unknown function [Aminobacter niigataensis]
MFPPYPLLQMRMICIMHSQSPVHKLNLSGSAMAQTSAVQRQSSTGGETPSQATEERSCLYCAHRWFQSRSRPPQTPVPIHQFSVHRSRTAIAFLAAKRMALTKIITLGQG